MSSSHSEQFSDRSEDVASGDGSIKEMMLRGTVEIMHRHLQTDSQGNPLQENEETRIGDIGVGTFVLLIVVLTYIAICCFGSMIKRPGWLYCWSTFFATIIIVFLFCAQRTSRWVTEEETVQDVDDLFNARLFLGIFLIWSTFWTCCAYTYWHLTPNVQAADLELNSQESAFVKARPLF
ncbi:hypothetical protein TrLO_g11277 [Triparma laevis f. longispina]|uniref:Uncharacterized protein n=1 Tax=Triparma laevis f. longispina TaxID=1714387 RepID=A0A9W6ZUJ9_9STRA|nr:hypothetical protein TrLO_g11277 [Triparma laevis f. longispina]